MPDVGSGAAPEIANAALSERGEALADLPPPETRRWVARRKAQVVAAVRAGVLSLEEACRRYTLSAEEFAGLGAGDRPARPQRLRVTRLQEFRQG